MSLLISRALSDEMPTVMRGHLADRGAGGLLDLAELQALQRDAPLDEPLLEHLAHGPQAVLAGRAEREREVGLLDGRAGALEVEAGGQLALGLIDGVADLLVVDLGDDIERRHGVQPRRAGARRSAVGYHRASWVGARVAKGSRL